jgi:hypothetical protein
LPPSPPVEGGGSGSDRLFALRTCLNDLQTAMQGGQWEALPQLTDRLGQSLQQLNTHQATPRQAEADELRQLLAQAGELQAQANVRQQQIGPLLRAWRNKPEADDAPPP